MAIETVRTFELKINGINSVKDLKNHISNLRDELVRLDDTSEEYSQTVDELVASQKKLTSVMSATKESTKGAEGSYNSLVKEMRALKVVWREITNEAERAKIGERINEINEELKRMDSTIGNSQRKVGSYEEAIKKALMTPQQELKKLKKELAGMEQGTAEYNATFSRMAQLTHDVTEQQEMLKWSSADLGDILGNLAGVAQGIAGGFSAINAVSGLISDGNEDVEKAMLTAQRWLQLIQGLGALEELGDRLKGLWQGIKNYTQAQASATSSVNDFKDEAKEVSASVNNATKQIDAQATSTAQADSVTKEYIKTKEELVEVEKEYSEAVKMQILYSNNELQSLQGRLSLLKASGNADEKQIKQLEQRIDFLKQNVVSLEKENVIIKKVGDNTSWLSKQIQALNKWFNGLSQSSNKLVAGFGKAGVSAMALGTTIKTALISTGIGFLIVLLGTAVSWLWKYVDGSAKAEERTKKLGEATDKLNESLEKKDKAWEREEKLLNAQGASYEELYEAEKKHLQAKLAEVQASLATAQAMAKEIGQRRLQKAKYDEFRQTLEDLIEQEKDLKIALEDLEIDKETEAIKKNTTARKENAKAFAEQRKEAEKLYKELKDYYKSDTQKLKEKYLEDKKALEKLNPEDAQKAKALLYSKYLIDLENLTMNATKSIYDRVRANIKRELETYNKDSEDFYNAQIAEAERYRDNISATIETVKAGEDAVKAFRYLNDTEGTDITTMQEANTELKIAEKNLNNLKNSLLEWQSSKAMKAVNKGVEGIANEAQNAFNRHDMSWEMQATTNFAYTGLSPEEQRTELENRYALQAEYLQREIDLYKNAIATKNLTDEERINLVNGITALEIQQKDLLAQKTIESNYLMIDSYENMTTSIMGIAGALTDVLSSVSDVIMENADAQLKAGKITEEEYNRQFKKSKAIQIATATINTIAGALGAFMGITKDTGGWGIALAIAQATAVFTAGMAQIQKIKNTQPNNSSGGSNGRYAEVTATPTSDFKPTYTQNITGQQETEYLANALSKTPIWVSVKDIDNAQNAGRVRVAESSF